MTEPPAPQQPTTWGHQPPPPPRHTPPPAGWAPPQSGWVPPTPQRRDPKVLAAIGGGLAVVLIIIGLAVASRREFSTAIADTAPTAAANDDPGTAGAPGPDDTATDDSGTTADSPPVPQQLRDLDIADGHAGGSPTAYTRAFKTLSSRCKEQGVGLGNEIGATLKLLRQAGIHDENRLTVMQHVADSIPPGQKMRFADIAGAYVTLREGS